IFSADPPAFPNNISPDVLALLGISGGSYLISKGIQTSRDTQLSPDKLSGVASNLATTTTAAPSGPTGTSNALTVTATGGSGPYTVMVHPGGPGDTKVIAQGSDGSGAPASGDLSSPPK